MDKDQRALVVQRLQQIEASNGGRLTAEHVVADAKQKDSPLHQHFEWDVKKAAHEHWLRQARSLIAQVHVKVHTEYTVVNAPFYVRDPRLAPDEQGYVSVAQLRDDRDLAREALVAEFGRVASLLRRARALALAVDAGSDVDSLLETVAGLQRRFSSEGNTHPVPS